MGSRRTQDRIGVQALVQLEEPEVQPLGRLDQLGGERAVFEVGLLVEVPAVPCVRELLPQRGQGLVGRRDRRAQVAQVADPGRAAESLERGRDRRRGPQDASASSSVLASDLSRLGV